MASVMRYTATQAPTVDYAQAPAAPPPPPVDIFAGVPEIVEDRRLDAGGGTVVRRYERGRLLGKVSFKCMRYRFNISLNNNAQWSV